MATSTAKTTYGSVAAAFRWPSTPEPSGFHDEDRYIYQPFADDDEANRYSEETRASVL